MSETFGWTELVAAAVGASAAGLFGIFDRRGERCHKKRAILVSTRAQVAFLCDLIRSQNYHEDARVIAENCMKADWDGGLLLIDARNNYLDIFESLKSDFGLLDDKHINPIVEFYNRAKIFIDSTKTDGSFLETANFEERRSHAIETHRNIERLLAVGDQIAQFGQHK